MSAASPLESNTTDLVQSINEHAEGLENAAKEKETTESYSTKDSGEPEQQEQVGREAEKHVTISTNAKSLGPEERQGTAGEEEILQDGNEENAEGHSKEAVKGSGNGLQPDESSLVAVNDQSELETKEAALEEDSLNPSGLTSTPMSKNPTETSNISATPTATSSNPVEIPTSSFVRINSPAAGTSSGSTSILGSAPKKFSTVNINKKFLGKTGTSASIGPSGTGLAATKATGGLSSLARPSLSPNPSSTSTYRLTSAKLTSVISSKPSPVTGALSNAPTAGWAKPSPRPSPGVSPTREPHLAQLGGSVINAADTSKTASSGLGSLKRAPMGSSPIGFGMSLGTKVKREWAPLPTAEAHRSGLGREFPTAGEVIEGQRQAQSQAQSIAQARAAHNAALIQGLDSFRGKKRDPNMHYWDEDDDENAVDDVIDFGDGTTYTIASLPKPATTQPEEPQQPVSKEERFAEDFDRSWPPQGPPPQSSQASRAIYNDRSNRFEPHADKIANQQTQRPQQILSRQGGDRPIETGFQGRGERLPSMSEMDSSRQVPPHMRDVPRAGQHLADRPPPPHMRNVERAPPPHLAGPASAQSSRELPPRSAQVNPAQSYADRIAASHSNATEGSDRNPRPDRWASREREQANGPEEGHALPDSGRPRTQSLAHAQHTGLSERAISSERSPAGVAPTLPEVPAVAEGDISVTQKDEMHEAAERARLRRQQEESEREARAERARQKAKELEDRMNALAPAAPQPTPPTISKILPRRLSTEQNRMPPIIRSPELNKSHLPQENMTRVQVRPREIWRPDPPTRDEASGLDAARLSRAVSRQPPPHVTSSSLLRPANPPTASSGPIAPSNRSPVNQLKALSPEIRSRPLHSTVELNESRDDSPVTMEFVEFQNSKHDQDDARELPPHLKAAQTTGAEGPQNASRFGRRINDSSTWRRGPESHGDQQQPPNAARSDEVHISGLPSQQELFKAAAEAGVVTNLSQLSALPELKGVRLPKPVESESNFDEIMARIKSAIVMESSAASHSRTVPPPVITTEEPVKTEEPAPAPAPASVEEPVVVAPEAPIPLVRYIALPRPSDFSESTPVLPFDPPPAWKTFTTRLPKVSVEKKPALRRRNRSDQSTPTPRGWLLSWNPPFEQLNHNTLSRDEWLVPATYVRGKVVSPVVLPTGTFSKYVKPEKSDEAIQSSTAANSPEPRLRSTEEQSMKESSQTVASEDGKPTESPARKIVVNLPKRFGRPTSTAPSRSEQLKAHIREPRVISEAISLPGPEDVQTTQDLDLLLASPSGSEQVLPEVSNKGRSTPVPVQRAVSSRRLPDGTGVIFARNHQSSFSEDPEVRSSVRFMVSSELEGDNLLEEVNNMSMDGLMENSLDATADATRKEEASDAARRQTIGRAGAPSPNAAASAAWAKSSPYTVSQSNNRGLSDRDHIKNVWSQPENDSVPQGGNSLMGIADDLPPALPISLQELKVEGDKAERRQAQVDMDSPRFASIVAVRSDSQDTNLYNPLSQTSGGDLNDGQAYGRPNGSTYGYQMGNTPSPNTAHQSSFGGQHGLPNINTGNVNGLPGQHRGQHGVWVPLNQAGMSASGNLNAPMGGYIGVPGSPVYGSTGPITKGAGRNSGGYNANAQSAQGMYSHTTGPLDSPSLSYMRPNLPMNNSYQTHGGPHSAYPSNNQGYGMRDGYSGYGMSNNTMRNSGGGPGHSRYASMGSVRNGNNPNGYGNYDQSNRNVGAGTAGGYGGMNGTAPTRQMSAGGGGGGRSSNGNGSMAGGAGAVKRPW